MPNKFTVYHRPPIESVVKRAIFFGGREDEDRMWKVMHQFSEEGAMPDASFGLFMLGANAMVWHHATSERQEDGKMSAVCAVPGTPFVFVCDAAAIEPKPFDQQVYDLMQSRLKKQGLKTCDACSGAGMVEQKVTDQTNPTGLPFVSIGTCETCKGHGVVKDDRVKQQVPKPAPKPDRVPLDPESVTKGQMIRDLRKETGATLADCREALENTAWNFEKAVDWLDHRRKDKK